MLKRKLVVFRSFVLLLLVMLGPILPVMLCKKAGEIIAEFFFMIAGMLQQFVQLHQVCNAYADTLDEYQEG